MTDADASLWQVLAATTQAHGEREAFVAPGERLTWNDVLAGARETAAALYAAGVRRGDHVGNFLGRCKARCANFKVPRYLAFVDTFDHIGMTGSNKVQKNKLRAHTIMHFGLGD